MTENFSNKQIPNIDTAEIAKFEAMAPIWWDKKGAFKALHDINVLRLDYIDERAPLSGQRVLDVGCGGGILSEAMTSLGAEVTGIDMGQAPLAVAKLHLQKSGLSVDYQNTFRVWCVRARIPTASLSSPLSSSSGQQPPV